MIDAGKYKWVDEEIVEEHFPLPTELNGEEVSVLGKLFHFNRSISSEETITEIDKAGYRPATLAELLSFAEAHFKLQKEFPIVALGSTWYGSVEEYDEEYDDWGECDLYVPILYYDACEHTLSLGRFGCKWDASSRFLAIRKEPLKSSFFNTLEV